MHRAKTGKLSQRCVAILATVLVLLALVPTFAWANGGVTFNGDDSASVWEYDSVNVTAYGYDLFGAVTKDLVPGDARDISVSLRNNTSDPVDFRLVARPLTLAEARTLETSYPGKTANDALLDVIDLRVLHGTTTLYSGTLRGASTSEMYSDAGVAIGRVSAGWAGTITVELSVRSDAGNAVASKLCAVEWVFVAAQYNEDEPPPPQPPPTDPSGSTTPVGAGGDDTTVVVVDDTPLSELPDTPSPTTPRDASDNAPDVTIEAEPVPQAPGAASAWALLNLMLTVVSGVLMLALMVRFLLARGRRQQASSSEVSGQGVTVERWTEDGSTVPVEHREITDRHARLRGLFWLGGICTIVVSVLLFILTEDMRLPMQWVDIYTLWHVLIVLIEVVLLLVPLGSKRSRYEGATG